MGTDMTPIASQKPSRTTTPLRAITPAVRSPVSSGSSTPMRCQHGMQAAAEDQQTCVFSSNGICEANSSSRANGVNTLIFPMFDRYNREEVKIQAWENHDKRKAEMEMKKMEVKAERMKAQAQERLANKIAATRRIVEEKRVNAKAQLNEKAVRIHRAGYRWSPFDSSMQIVHHQANTIRREGYRWSLKLLWDFLSLASLMSFNLTRHR
ncbi:hypothetical protein UlMin_036650 [Ulmus minor]